MIVKNKVSRDLGSTTGSLSFLSLDFLHVELKLFAFQDIPANIKATTSENDVKMAKKIILINPSN